MLSLFSLSPASLSFPLFQPPFHSTYLSTSLHTRIHTPSPHLLPSLFNPHPLLLLIDFFLSSFSSSSSPPSSHPLLPLISYPLPSPPLLPILPLILRHGQVHCEWRGRHNTWHCRCSSRQVHHHSQSHLTIDRSSPLYSLIYFVVSFHFQDLLNSYFKSCHNWI